MKKGGTLMLTGSEGFIGRNLYEYLQSIHRQVLRPTLIELDLMNKQQLEKYLKVNNVKIVIHCANTIVGTQDPYTVLDHNLRMFFNLTCFAERLDKLIYFGSGAEYGRHVLPPLVKEEQLGLVIPVDAYGFAKYIMSQIAISSRNIYDLCCFGVYGKYELWNQRFISNNIVKLLAGGPMTLSQDAMFDYLYVADLCQIVEWFIENVPKYHHYNVCTSRPIALSAIASIIGRCAGTETELLVEKKGWQSEYSGDNSRLMDEVGDFRFTDIEAGVRELLGYYKGALASNPDHFRL